MRPWDAGLVAPEDRPAFLSKWSLLTEGAEGVIQTSGGGAVFPLRAGHCSSRG